MRLPIATALLALSLAPAQAQAQAMVRLNLGSSFTDNLFQNSQAQTDWRNLLDVDVDWPLGGATGVYYTGNADLFSEYRQLSTHAHTVGWRYARTSAVGGTFAGASLAARLGGEAASYRDYIGASAYGRGKRYLRQDVLLRGGYVLSLQEYLHSAPQSYAEQALTGQLTGFLPSRTTLDVRTELGVKSYLRPGVEALTGVARGRNLVEGTARLKLAQSLGSRAGLQLEYSRQHRLAGASRSVVDALLDPEGELFSDRYAYDGNTIGTTLKYLGPWGTELELGAGRGVRDFVDRLALDQQGMPLGLGQTRLDRWHAFDVGVDRLFTVGAGTPVEADLGWHREVTGSNDPYWDADANTYSLGLRYTF
jgi:hypothetical protein